MWGTLEPAIKTLLLVIRALQVVEHANQSLLPGEQVSGFYSC